MNAAPLVTVLVPTYDHGPTLLRAIPSALRQSIQELEIFVVGDGIPAEHRWVIDELCSLDSRIKYFDNEKGARHGELHRHAALAEARGRYVAYLSDDDLWFPDHVETLLRLLEHADLAHTRSVICRPDGSWQLATVDLGLDFYREFLAEQGKSGPIPVPMVPMSSFGHRLDSYRKLVGWRTTPEGLYTDLYMWQQFLNEPGMQLASGSWPTVLDFSSADAVRRKQSPEERCEELDQWADYASKPPHMHQLRERVIDALGRESAWREANIVHLQGSLQLRDHDIAELTQQNKALEVQLSERDRYLEQLAQQLQSEYQKHEQIRSSATWTLRSKLVDKPAVRWLRRPMRALAKRAGARDSG